MESQIVQGTAGKGKKPSIHRLKKKKKPLQNNNGTETNVADEK